MIDFLPLVAKCDSELFILIICRNDVKCLVADVLIWLLMVDVGLDGIHEDAVLIGLCVLIGSTQWWSWGPIYLRACNIFGYNKGHIHPQNWPFMFIFVWVSYRRPAEPNVGGIGWKAVIWRCKYHFCGRCTSLNICLLLPDISWTFLT